MKWILFQKAGERFPPAPFLKNKVLLMNQADTNASFFFFCCTVWWQHNWTEAPNLTSWETEPTVLECEWVNQSPACPINAHPPPLVQYTVCEHSLLTSLHRAPCRDSVRGEKKNTQHQLHLTTLSADRGRASMGRFHFTGSSLSLECLSSTIIHWLLCVPPLIRLCELVLWVEQYKGF